MSRTETWESRASLSLTSQHLLERAYWLLETMHTTPDGLLLVSSSGHLEAPALCVQMAGPLALMGGGGDGRENLSSRTWLRLRGREIHPSYNLNYEITWKN